MTFEFQKLVVEQFEKFKLYEQGWNFSLIKSKIRRGLCDSGKKEVSVNILLIDNEKEFKKTLLHEIAHVIAGVRNGHNKKWKSVCYQIGAEPKVRGKEIEGLKHKYKLYCPKCKEVIGHKDRKTKRGWIHITCKTIVEVRENDI